MLQPTQTDLLTKAVLEERRREAAGLRSARRRGRRWGRRGESRW